MYEYSIDNKNKKSLYDDLYNACEAITHGETDAVANMANVASLLWQYIPQLNWAGFYRIVDGALLLGPFQGKAACIHIPLDKGVCGAAASTGEPQCVEDVNQFAGHIACDAESVSELVAPIKSSNGNVIAVIDLDSPNKARFDEQDIDGIIRIAEMLGPRLSESA